MRIAQTTVVLHRHRAVLVTALNQQLDGYGRCLRVLDRILEAFGVIAQPFTATTSLPIVTPALKAGPSHITSVPDRVLVVEHERPSEYEGSVILRFFFAAGTVRGSVSPQSAGRKLMEDVEFH